MIEKPNFFLFTGGPGVGKTALLRHLETLGERVVEETHRAVIAEQVAAGGRAVPWDDHAAYCELAVGRDIAKFDAAAGETRRVFFDRGIIDGFDPRWDAPADLLRAARDRRYNRRVFVFPPLAGDLRDRRRAAAGLGGGRGDLPADPRWPGAVRLRRRRRAAGPR
jgi:predicted ATPase